MNDSEVLDYHKTHSRQEESPRDRIYQFEVWDIVISFLPSNLNYMYALSISITSSLYRLRHFSPPCRLSALVEKLAQAPISDAKVLWIYPVDLKHARPLGHGRDGIHAAQSQPP